MSGLTQREWNHATTADYRVPILSPETGEPIHKPDLSNWPCAFILELLFQFERENFVNI